MLIISGSYLLAADEVDKAEPKDVKSFRLQARVYRNEGLRAQSLGDLDSALVFYQKAVELDPEYQVVYNDLGIIYEAKGEPERAEASYLKALAIDPYYLSAYSNLALFYESKRDLVNAAEYWKKRYELGNPEDLWTMKAQQRLKDIQLMLAADPLLEVRLKQIRDLTRGTRKKKKILVEQPAAVQLQLNKEFQDPAFTNPSKEYETAMREALNSSFPEPFENKDFQF